MIVAKTVHSPLISMQELCGTTNRWLRVLSSVTGRQRSVPETRAGWAQKHARLVAGKDDQEGPERQQAQGEGDGKDDTSASPEAGNSHKARYGKGMERTRLKGGYVKDYNSSYTRSTMFAEPIGFSFMHRASHTWVHALL